MKIMKYISPQRPRLSWVTGVFVLCAGVVEAGTCSYNVQNEWQNGFVASIKITNTETTPINGWQVSWAYTDGSVRSGGWNASFSGSNPYSASDMGWNGKINPGQSIEFGVQGSKPNGMPAQKPLVTGAVCSLSQDSSSSVVSSENSSSSESDSSASTLSSSRISSSVQSISSASLSSKSLESSISSSQSSGRSSTSNAISSSSWSSASSVAPDIRVDNPFAASKNWYVDPIWSAKVNAEPGGGAIANYNTAVWMDRIGAIAEPVDGNGLGLRGHLDNALVQGADLFMFVVYDLPNRDCAALASNGELLIAEDGFNRYKNEYINSIVSILSDPAYKRIRIAAIIEVDSLPNLVTNTTIAKCSEAAGPGGYRDGVRYALNELAKLDNVYSYVDIAHSGWLGWSSNFGPAVKLIADTIKSTEKGWGSVSGFVTNSANYTPVEEPFLPDPSLQIGGNPIRSADFYEWNEYFEEKAYAIDWRKAMMVQGAPARIGMLIDTGRNGWGGPDRPTKESTATDKNRYVDESRIDRRLHRGNWCNQAGGVGFKPWADPYPGSGIHAFVWVKPQGESDGISDQNFTPDPNDPAKRHDPMCDPLANNRYNTKVKTGALPNAPHAGRWFPEAVQVLLDNAYPAATDPAGPPPPPPGPPTDCAGLDASNPIALDVRNADVTLDLKCGPVYVSFPAPVQGIQFDNTGAPFNIKVSYGAVTKTSGSGYSWGSGITGNVGVMKIERVEGSAKSVKIRWYN